MITLWFKIGGSGDSGRSFIRSGRNRWLIGSESDSELESSLGGPGGLETVKMNFLGALEIPSSEKGSSCRLGCLVSALVGGILIVSSSNKVPSLPCPVMVEIGGMLLSSPPNLGALTR